MRAGASAPLVPYVLRNNIKRRPATRPNKVGAAPKHGLIVSRLQIRELMPQATRGHSLQRVNQLRQLDLGIILNQEMNVISLAIAFLQLRFKVRTDF